MGAVKPGCNGDGRAEGGRFGPGNKIARGNPNNRRMYELRQKLLGAVTPEAMEAIGKKLVIATLKGDLDATKVLLAYTIGRPPQAVELSGPEGEPLGVGLAELKLILVQALEPFGADAKIAVAQAIMKLSRTAAARGDEDEKAEPC
jgi:hypothetical protein